MKHGRPRVASRHFWTMPMWRCPRCQVRFPVTHSPWGTHCFAQNAQTARARLAYGCRGCTCAAHAVSTFGASEVTHTTRPCRAAAAPVNVCHHWCCIHSAPAVPAGLVSTPNLAPGSPQNTEHCRERRPCCHVFTEVHVRQTSVRPKWCSRTCSGASNAASR